MIYGLNNFGIMEDYINLSAKFSNPEEYQAAAVKLAEKPEMQKFYYLMMATLVFLFPLNMGFYRIYRKIDLKEKFDLVDLFAGYMGINFFIYSSYYLFWIIIFGYTMPTLVLAPVWIFMTLFSAPLMFFMDKRIFESIAINFKALKLFFPEILVCMLVAVIFKYLGMLTIIAGFFTFPFVNAMIYALYRSIFNEKNEVLEQSAP